MVLTIFQLAWNRYSDHGTGGERTDSLTVQRIWIEDEERLKQ
jgi:hypothetical protein